ncbi:MAG: response regulator, partial [Muribaculaceae bacterium]|nr:response regulator [Muribaculaceae bacterium]
SGSVFNAEDKIDADKLVMSLNHYEYTIPTLVGLNKSVHDEAQQVETKLSILIVEDNSELLKFLSDIFAVDYSVYTAVNGKAALDILLNTPIDIVLSDIMMPEMDGNTLCLNIKNNISTSHIPVVLLTAKSDETTMKQGFESGADAYIQKPFDPDVLLLQIKNILKTRQLQRDSMRKSQGRDVDVTSLSSYDKEFIDTINEIVDKHIDDSDFSVTDITQIMGISRTLLHVKMKGLFNISAGDYIRKKRFAKACELLKKGYKISEAAYMAGFADPNYFSKSFKKEYNMTPTEYLMANYPPHWDN